MLDRLILPDGVSLYELDQRLEKWVQFHTTSLMAACLHAIRLPENINNIRTHVMYVRLQAREDHGNSAGKYFRVIEAYPVIEKKGPVLGLAGKEQYVVFNPAAGMNRFALIFDSFASGIDLQHFQVDISYLQGFRKMKDGVTYDHIFSGASADGVFGFGEGVE